MVKRTLATVALVIGGMATLATVAAFFAGIWWGFDLLTNYRWHMMWAALLASVIYALFGRGLLAAVFIVAMVVNLWPILPSWVGTQPAASGEDTVRVIHIDLSGTVGDDDQVIMWLVERDADLLLVAGASPSTVDAVSAAVPSYSLLTGDTSEEVAVFARGTWSVATVFDASGGPVHRVGVPSGTGIIDVITAWGVMPTSEGTNEALMNRFDTITNTVKDSVNPVIVVGNLGATRWSVVSRSLLANSTLRDATEGAGYISTWPTSNIPIIGRWVGIPIDVAYVGPALTPLDVMVGPDIGAEHLPLTIDISPAAEGS